MKKQVEDFTTGPKRKTRAFNNYPKVWGEGFALNKVLTNQCFIFHVSNFGRNQSTATLGRETGTDRVKLQTLKKQMEQVLSLVHFFANYSQELELGSIFN